MDIMGISAGTNMTIIVRKDQEKLEFNTSVLEQFDDCLVVEPILSDGKLLDFSSDKVQVSVQYFNASIGRIYGWDRVRIKAGILRRKDKCHIIHIDGGAYEMNRRENYRLYLGCDCKVSRGRRELCDGTIRDLSNVGLGVILGEGYDLDVGSEMDISFRDQESAVGFILNAVVIRIRQFDGKYEYGCKLKNPPGALPKYIAHRQLINRKRAMGF